MSLVDDLTKSLALIISSFSRPADTNNYAAGDIVANSTSAATLNELTNVASGTGRGGVIQNLTLTKTGTGVTGAVFEVLFFSSRSASIPANDNAAENVLAANAPYFLGSVLFPAMTTGAGASNTAAKATVQQVAFPYACEQSSLFWTVRCAAAYTDEASGETFILAATVIRDTER